MFSVLKFDIEEKIKNLGMSYLWDILLLILRFLKSFLMSDFGTVEIELALHMALTWVHNSSNIREGRHIT